MMDLFEEWQVVKKPSAQTAAEFRRAASAFVDFIGDIPVIEIGRDDLLNFRDAVAKLPVAMSAADRRLSFTEQVIKFGEGTHQHRGLVTGATVKKKVGAIQALISLAAFERWIKQNVGRDIPIRGYSKTSGTSRRSFGEDSLIALFPSPLFLS